MEESEKRKAIELLKEMRSGDNTEDGKPNNQVRLNWMYKTPSDFVDKEEYLLGKAIDRTFEVLNSGESSDIVGRTGEQSNVPKRILEKSENTEQVDIAKKILEDPLYAIKQKEMEARKKLLNNPVKLKQIKQLLLERSKQNSLHKHKKKKKSEHNLNILILKKLKKFTDKEKRKALKKIMQSDSDSSSAESSSSCEKEYKKRKSKRKRSSSSSEESDTSSSSSSSENEVKKSKAKKSKKEIMKRKESKKTRSSSSDSSSSDNKKRVKSRNKKANKKHSKKSSTSSESESSSGKKSSKKFKDRDRRPAENSTLKHDRRDSKVNKSRSHERKDRDRKRDEKQISRREVSSERDKKFKKNFGLMMPDGSKPDKRSKASPVQKYEKNVETKTKYVPPAKVKPLSEKEKEEKLKEMMADAKVRKADREKNLANHRKKEAEEEKLKDYDNDFMRRQMSHLTSQGTMADRIKSNINNIQRSSSSMDTNFMRK